MAKTLESRPSLFEPYGHSDLYALDHLYFSAFKKKEIWDFSKLREFSPLVLGFLFARAELRIMSGFSDLEVRELSPSFKKGICLISGREEAVGVHFDSFLPTLLGAESSLFYDSLDQTDKDRLFGDCFSGSGFCIQGEWNKKNYLIYFSGKNADSKNLPLLLGKLSRFSSENEISGNFFLRTEKQSYLNFIKPKEVLGALFLQEKSEELPPFLFLALEYKKVSSKPEIV